MDSVHMTIPGFLGEADKAALVRRVPGVITLAGAQDGIPLVPCPNSDNTLILNMTSTPEKRARVAATLAGLPWAEHTCCAACGDDCLIPQQHRDKTGARVCWVCIAVLGSITYPPLTLAMVEVMP